MSRREELPSSRPSPRHARCGGRDGEERQDGPRHGNGPREVLANEACDGTDTRAPTINASPALPFNTQMMGWPVTARGPRSIPIFVRRLVAGGAALAVASALLPTCTTPTDCGAPPEVDPCPAAFDVVDFCNNSQCTENTRADQLHSGPLHPHARQGVFRPHCRVRRPARRARFARRTVMGLPRTRDRSRPLGLDRREARYSITPRHSGRV